jgi:hypothetical protein
VGKQRVQSRYWAAIFNEKKMLCLFIKPSFVIELSFITLTRSWNLINYLRFVHVQLALTLIKSIDKTVHILIGQHSCNVEFFSMKNTLYIDS